MSASALPSATELHGVTTVDDVLQVLHLSDPVWQAFTAQVGDPGLHVRILAALPRAVVIQGCVQGTLPTGEMLTAMQATHVGLVWRTCRKVIHLWAGLPEGDFIDIDPWANDPADKVKENQQGASPQGATAVKERILKMANVVDQADDSELLLATRTELDKWANCYVAVMGAPPPEEEEPNEAQLSALHRRVNVLKQPPYADFGVWLPFARRTQKAQKFRAFMPVGRRDLCCERDARAAEHDPMDVLLEGVQGGPHHAGCGIPSITPALREDGGAPGDAVAKMLAPYCDGR